MKLLIPYATLPAGLVVDAEQIGAFAIHRKVTGWQCLPSSVAPTVFLHDTDWSVTHIQSGGFCTEAMDEDHARQAAHSYNAMPVNWKFDDPAVPHSWPRRLKNYGRNIAKAARGIGWMYA